MTLKHFTDRELADPLTGEVNLAPGFGEMIDELRVILGEPMIVNSCCRSLAHNTAIRGHPRSLHLIGNAAHGTDTCAIDVAVRSSAYRGRLLYRAWQRGFSVGWGAGFLHLDQRTKYAGLAQTTFDYK